MPRIVQNFRTATANNPPANLSLLPGQLSVEMNDPMRLWVGVPTTLDATGRKMLLDTTTAGGSYVPISGGTMTGFLTLNANPTAALHATPRQYVDAADGALQGQIDVLAEDMFFVGGINVVTNAGDYTLASGLVDGPLPAAAPAYKGWYVIVTQGGTAAAGNIPAGQDVPGDWIVCDGTAPWIKLPLGQASVVASQVAISPAIGSLGANVQTGLTWLNTNKLNLAGGTMTGFLTLNAPPTANLHAATKAYVDSVAGKITEPVGAGTWGRLAAGSWQRTVATAGDTMTGFLTLNAAPTANLHAATKAYADTKLTQATADGRYVNTAGDTMTGPLNVPSLAVSGSATVGANLAATTATINALTVANYTMVNSQGVRYSGVDAGTSYIAFNWAGSQLHAYHDGVYIGPLGLGTGAYLPLTGGTVTGPTTFSGALTVGGATTLNGGITANAAFKSTSTVELAGNATLPLQAVPLQQMQGYVLKTGDTMTGRLTIRPSTSQWETLIIDNPTTNGQSAIMGKQAGADKWHLNLAYQLTGDFQLSRFIGSASYSTVMTAEFATGNVTFGESPTIRPGSILSHGRITAPAFTISHPSSLAFQIAYDTNTPPRPTVFWNNNSFDYFDGTTGERRWLVSNSLIMRLTNGGLQVSGNIFSNALYPAYTLAPTFVMYNSGTNVNVIQMQTDWLWYFNCVNGDMHWMGAGAGALWSMGYNATYGWFTWNSLGPVGGMGAYVAMSDERVKERIAPATVGLSEVLALEPIEFVRKVLKPDPEYPIVPRQEIGFSAQQVKRIIPQAVGEVDLQLSDGKGGLDPMIGMLGLSIDPIVAALVNGMKEIVARLMVLEGTATGRA